MQDVCNTLKTATIAGAVHRLSQSTGITPIPRDRFDPCAHRQGSFLFQKPKTLLRLSTSTILSKIYIRSTTPLALRPAVVVSRIGFYSAIEVIPRATKTMRFEDALFHFLLCAGSLLSTPRASVVGVVESCDGSELNSAPSLTFDGRWWT